VVNYIKRYWLYGISIILGIIFLLSGYGKLNGVNAFEALIESYGFPHLTFLAPVIILAEILSGILLIIGFRPKLMGAVSCIMLIIFTLMYTYAYLVHGITDCGCFGDNPLLKSSPAISYIRNALMIALSVILIVFGNNNKELSKVLIYCISIIMVVCAFFIGIDFRIPSMFVGPHPLYHKPLAETSIPKYVELSNDSTYVIYVFSYDCSSCWNNMANFMNYDTDSIADRSIGLCVGGQGKDVFMNYFKPRFDIIEVGDGLSNDLQVVPSLLYIKDGMIHDIIQGQAINPKLFKLNYIEN